MVVLVTGGRDFTDSKLVQRTLNYLHKGFGFSTLVHGAASGADTLCGEWAESKGIPVLDKPADWKKHGRGAGPIRNSEMLEECPDIRLLIVFPGGKGTADMVRKAEAAGIVIFYVPSRS